VSPVWNAALAQKYIDAMLPKPKRPRRPKKKPRFFTLAEVSKIIAAVEKWRVSGFRNVENRMTLQNACSESANQLGTSIGNGGTPQEMWARVQTVLETLPPLRRGLLARLLSRVTK
jgi:hypothetical protein